MTEPSFQFPGRFSNPSSLVMGLQPLPTLHQVCGVAINRQRTHSLRDEEYRARAPGLTGVQGLQYLPHC